MSGHIWTLPLVLALLSLIGLAAALVGDGLWDGLSWLCLGLPVALILWHLARQWPRRP